MRRGGGPGRGAGRWASLGFTLICSACAHTAPVAPPPGVLSPTEPVPPVCVAEDVARGLLPADLGFSLAPGTARGGRSEAALAAMRDVRVRVDMENEPSPNDAVLRAVAGAPRCAPPEGPLSVAGRPPRLLVSELEPELVERLAWARIHQAHGRFAEARVALAGGLAFTRGSRVDLLVRVAATYEAEGRLGEAGLLFTRARGDFPWSREAAEGVGRVVRAAGRSREAIAALGWALALDPSSISLGAAASTIVIAEALSPVVPPARRVLEPGGVRWIARPRVGVSGPLVRAEAQAYVTCKEAMRLSGALRAAIVGDDLPLWRWSPAEESLCTAMWLAAYHVNRRQGLRVEEPDLELLLEIHAAGFAAERAIWDVGARVYPEAPLLLDEQRLARLVEFVQKYRLRPRQDAGLLFP